MNQKASSRRPCLCIDVGGTFTDAVLVDVEGNESKTKTLSSGLTYARVEGVEANRVRVDQFSNDGVENFWRSAWISCDGQRVGNILASDRHGLTVDSAASAFRVGDGIVIETELATPVLAAHQLLGIPIDRPLPPLDVRLGTTRGTNALLTRSGAVTGFVVTQGFADLLDIGEQDRGDLFDLNIQNRRPLHEHVVEIDHRMSADGSVLREIDVNQVRNDLVRLKEAGCESIAICLLHSTRNDAHEKFVEQAATVLGFQNISRSSEVSGLVKMVSRSETTVLDAYLNPILGEYLNQIEAQFGGSKQCRLLVMTSNGNLVPPEQFRGRDSVLSGPAGGVVALEHVAKRLSLSGVIGLDMGGTSTDVSRYENRVGRRTESRVAGIRIVTPMMDIHTIAAGGGSVCAYRDGRLWVGPESAGASPGPACYGKGGPLTITDVNLVLGRLIENKFPFQLQRSAALHRLREIAEAMGKPDLGEAELLALAAGFFEIAGTHMAEAVRTVSLARGSDVREMALVGFGGAAGVHVCQVAEQLGIERIVDHPDAGLMSAIGIGLADVGSIATRGIYRRLNELSNDSVKKVLAELITENESRLINDSDGERSSDSSLEHQISVEARYVGTDAALTLPDVSADFDRAECMIEFHQMHDQTFGYRQDDRGIECVAIRCESKLKSNPSQLRNATSESTLDSRELGQQRVWSGGELRPTPVYDRVQLQNDAQIAGPAIVCGDHSTLMIDAGWEGLVDSLGWLEIKKVQSSLQSEADPLANDQVLLEVVTRRLQGIADSMGEVLRRTSISVNVKERRDYSCAVFRGDGTLVACAAHVPVHLGAMGHTVRAMASRFPSMSDGDCYLSNDPFAGGSHLPDVTSITPVFVHADRLSGRPDFFVASRAHHAEIGGKTPGSMPCDATCLADEGVLIRHFALIRNGQSHHQELRKLLSSGRYPSRNPDENLADVSAAVAAGRSGALALRGLVEKHSLASVESMMERLLQVADDQVVDFIERLGSSPLTYTDQLDDGTPLGVTISRSNDRLEIAMHDSPVHSMGFNATPAIVTAAVLYTLRCLCDSELPLCEGALRQVDIRIPPGLLNPPANENPKLCAAVVAGNVETSQRIVDVLLGAFGSVAASQGTMNNLLLGDETFGYYETIGGGAGATANGPGASGLHTHMTNTRITDPEIVETRLPVRLVRFQIRSGSGGSGLHDGGDGLIREFEFLKPLTLTMLTNRRTTQPYGVNGGQPGKSGSNVLVQKGESTQLRPSFTTQVHPGDRITIETPGGGGWGERDD